MVMTAMGQPIVVRSHTSPTQGVLRFEANRSLTGMGHLWYRADQTVMGDRPPDELARRLFAHGGVDKVHVFSNIVTVTMARGGHPEGIAEIIEGLYTYYREGVLPAIP
jgi:hypothetical protein